MTIRNRRIGKKSEASIQYYFIGKYNSHMILSILKIEKISVFYKQQNYKYLTKYKTINNTIFRTKTAHIFHIKD